MSTTTTNRPDVYSRITDKIIADLEQGVRTWMRPWNAEHAAGRITRPLRHNGIPSDTHVPGTRVSSTIRDFSFADQRRRRPGPVRISTRRNPPFASSLTSNITIARGPLPQAHPAHLSHAQKKGGGAPLTVKALPGQIINRSVI